VIGVVGIPGFALLSYRGGLYEFLVLTFILSMFQYVLSTTITGESTAIVKPTEKGTLLGLEHALFAAARIAAPQAGILLLDWGGVSAVSACCSVIFLGVLLTWNAYSAKVIITGKVSEKPGERKER
jgi:fucose permease